MMIPREFPLFVAPLKISGLITIYQGVATCHYHYRGYYRGPGDKCPCNCGFMELTLSSAQGYTLLKAHVIYSIFLKSKETTTFIKTLRNQTQANKELARKADAHNLNWPNL